MPRPPSATPASDLIPQPLRDALAAADPSWQPTIETGLEAVARADPGYLPALAGDDYLPTEGRIFAAFAQPLHAVRHVLVGEGPYPRAQSATGVCFMDGAVGGLWSQEEGGGLSKPVNRATSLRNFMKMLLVADGLLSVDDTGGAALAPLARLANRPGAAMVQTLPELQANLTAQGFLLLNAALVFRPHVPPVREAKAWHPFLRAVLESLAQREGGAPPSLVLWGKIAEQVEGMPAAAALTKIKSEHPYNLSFIANLEMQKLFRPMQLLRRINGSA